ncbi:MAG: NAD(P)-dependent oxidoreductase [Sandaracinaceae bacterium]
MIRVLLADKLAALTAGHLQDLGASVTTEPALRDDALIARLRELDPAVLVVRSTKVTAAHIDAARSLSLVIRAGAGVNTIDLAAASARGVYVANCPGKNAAAVAELTIGHLVNLDRRIADNVAMLREGQWDKKGFGGAPGLKGRTLAVLGCGTIGQEVIRRARAFGMTIRAWSRSLAPDQAEALGVLYAASPEEAVRDADAVTVHLALTPETRARIGESIFEAMKPGAYFINTSRGAVVDQEALMRALDERDLRAGLDVFDDEPRAAGPWDAAIAKHSHVYGTHHIGASTQEASEAVGEEVVRIVDAYRRGEVIPNCVNLAQETEATHTLVVRHRDEVGVLARVLDVLGEASINVQEMSNIVFSGGEAACARIELAEAPNAATLAKINEGAAIYDAAVTAH